MSKPKGLDPCVVKALEGDTGRWFEERSVSGFARERQNDPELPGYESTEKYKAHETDIIAWTWLDDIGLVDREGQYTRTESEKQRGLVTLKARLRAIAKERGELK